VAITHPFHPNTGKKYRLVSIIKPQGKETLLCQDADGKEFCVPIGYTSLSNTTAVGSQAKPTCDFRYSDLVVLRGILECFDVN
jgi:hypothetical protein